ncbi:MAG: hypothetical protein WCG06_06285, partial [Candidatus Omnitrophota bacterium]
MPASVAVSASSVPAQPAAPPSRGRFDPPSPGEQALWSAQAARESYIKAFGPPQGAVFIDSEHYVLTADPDPFTHSPFAFAIPQLTPGFFDVKESVDGHNMLKTFGYPVNYLTGNNVLSYNAMDRLPTDAVAQQLRIDRTNDYLASVYGGFRAADRDRAKKLRMSPYNTSTVTVGLDPVLLLEMGRVKREMIAAKESGQMSNEQLSRFLNRMDDGEIPYAWRSEILGYSSTPDTIPIFLEYGLAASKTEAVRQYRQLFKSDTESSDDEIADRLYAYYKDKVEPAKKGAEAQVEQRARPHFDRVGALAVSDDELDKKSKGPLDQLLDDIFRQAIKNNEWGRFEFLKKQAHDSKQKYDKAKRDLEQHLTQTVTGGQIMGFGPEKAREMVRTFEENLVSGAFFSQEGALNQKAWSDPAASATEAQQRYDLAPLDAHTLEEIVALYPKVSTPGVTLEARDGSLIVNAGPSGKPRTYDGVERVLVEGGNVYVFYLLGEKHVCDEINQDGFKRQEDMVIISATLEKSLTHRMDYYSPPDE